MEFQCGPIRALGSARIRRGTIFGGNIKTFAEVCSSRERSSDDHGVESGRTISTRPVHVARRRQDHFRRVGIPGSPPQNMPYCPAKPAGEWPHTDDQIRTWVRGVIEGGYDRGLCYTAEAITYFARSCYWPPYHTGVAAGRCPQHDRARVLTAVYAVQYLQGSLADNPAFEGDATAGT